MVIVLWTESRPATCPPILVSPPEFRFTPPDCVSLLDLFADMSLFPEYYESFCQADDFRFREWFAQTPHWQRMAFGIPDVTDEAAPSVTSGTQSVANLLFPRNLLPLRHTAFTS